MTDWMEYRWRAVERELGLNPDRGLALFDEFPALAKLLEGIREIVLRHPASLLSNDFGPFFMRDLRRTIGVPADAELDEIMRAVKVVMADKLCMCGHLHREHERGRGPCSRCPCPQWPQLSIPPEA